MPLWKGQCQKTGHRPDAAQSADWHRGAYLTQLLARCRCLCATAKAGR